MMSGTSHRAPTAMGQSIDSTMPGSELIELFVGPVGSYPMI